MKNILSLCFLFFIAIAFAQTDSTQHKKLKTTSVGIFDPWRISINKKHELSTQPLLFFVIPNAKLKYQWKKNLYSTHSFTIPTLLLKTISREGTGGILPVESKIPFILTTKHQLFFKKSLSEIHQLTFGIGEEIGFHGKNGNLTTIDYPIIFPRTHVYTNNFLTQIDFIWTICLYDKTKGCMSLSLTKFFLDLHSTYFYLPTKEKNYKAFEQSLTLRKETYKKGYKLGLKYSYGTYPFGKMSSFYPFLDVIFKIP